MTDDRDNQKPGPDPPQPTTEPRYRRELRQVYEGLAMFIAFWRAPVPISEPARPPKGPTGRPPEHDWKGALQFARAYVADKGLPKVQQRMVDLVQDWFKANDGRKAPDVREIRRQIKKEFYG